MKQNENIRAALDQKAWVHMSLTEKVATLDRAAEAIARFCHTAGNALPGLQGPADNIIYAHVASLQELSKLALETLSETKQDPEGQS